MLIKRIVPFVLLLSVFTVANASVKVLTLCFNRTVRLTSSYSGTATWPTSHNWTFDGAVVGSSGSVVDSIVSGLGFPAPKTYMVICTKNISDGSTIRDTFQINALEYRIQPFNFPDTTVCGNIGLNIGFSQGGTGFAYLWKPGNQTTQNITITSAGNYSGSIISFDAYTLQGFGVCDSAGDNFTVVQGAAADVNLGGNRIICGSDPITLDAGPGFTRYSWGPGGQISQTISISKSGIYTVSVENADGCKDNDVVVVRDSCPMYVWVPTAFTPNPNGNNDIFIWKGNMQMDRFEMRIFNRWGEKMYETTDPTKGWDGTFRKKLVPEGVYAWWIYIIDSNGVKHRLKGDVTVLID